MKLHVLSDIHTEFSDFVPSAIDADIVVLAGDNRSSLRKVSQTQRDFGLTPVRLITPHYSLSTGESHMSSARSTPSHLVAVYLSLINLSIGPEYAPSKGQVHVDKGVVNGRVEFRKID